VSSILTVRAIFTLPVRRKVLAVVAYTSAILRVVSARPSDRYDAR
jgi:hypothetical protein